MDLLTKVINKGYFWGEFESTILSREILSKEIARTTNGLRATYEMPCSTNAMPNPNTYTE